MIYKHVKKIDADISALGLGTWNFSGNWDNYDEQTCIEIVKKSFELGINLFDTAPVYGLGRSETVLGKALKDIPRDKVIIASKCGLTWDANNSVKNDLTKQSILKEIDDTLMRLQTDYIDIYQLHWPHYAVPLEETAEALNELRASGKIKYVGLSNYHKEDIEKMMQLTSVDCIQALYNLFERNAASYHGIDLGYKVEDEILPLVEADGQAFLPYSPLFQGLLTGEFKNGINFSKDDVRNDNPKFKGEKFELYSNILSNLNIFANKIDKPLNQIAINWLVNNKNVTSIIAGVSNLEQLQSNVDSLSWKLDDEMMSEIEEIVKEVKDI